MLANVSQTALYVEAPQDEDSPFEEISAEDFRGIITSNKRKADSDDTTEDGLMSPRKPHCHHPPITCGSCQEEVPFYDATPVPCGDMYCRKCVQGMALKQHSHNSTF